MGGTTLGEETMSPDIIKAGFGYKDRRSAEDYVDPTMIMQTIALTTIGRVVYDIEKMYENDVIRETAADFSDGNGTASEAIGKRSFARIAAANIHEQKNKGATLSDCAL